MTIAIPPRRINTLDKDVRQLRDRKVDPTCWVHIDRNQRPMVHKFWCNEIITKHTLLLHLKTHTLHIYMSYGQRYIIFLHTQTTLHLSIYLSSLWYLSIWFYLSSLSIYLSIRMNVCLSVFNMSLYVRMYVWTYIVPYDSKYACIHYIHTYWLTICIYIQSVLAMIEYSYIEAQLAVAVLKASGWNMEVMLIHPGITKGTLIFFNDRQYTIFIGRHTRWQAFTTWYSHDSCPPAGNLILAVPQQGSLSDNRVKALWKPYRHLPLLYESLLDVSHHQG